jgi:hypothetical protein
LGNSQNSFNANAGIGHLKEMSMTTNEYLKRHHLQSSNNSNIEQNTRFLDLEKLARLPKLR